MDFTRLLFGVDLYDVVTVVYTMWEIFLPCTQRPSANHRHRFPCRHVQVAAHQSDGIHEGRRRLGVPSRCAMGRGSLLPLKDASVPSVSLLLLLGAPDGLAGDAEGPRHRGLGLPALAQ